MSCGGCGGRQPLAVPGGATFSGFTKVVDSDLLLALREATDPDSGVLSALRSSEALSPPRQGLDRPAARQLLLVRVAETESGMTWGAMREELEEITLTRLSTKDGRSEIVSLLTDEQRKVLKKLRIKPPVTIRKLHEKAAKA